MMRRRLCWLAAALLWEGALVFISHRVTEKSIQSGNTIGTDFENDPAATFVMTSYWVHIFAVIATAIFVMVFWDFIGPIVQKRKSR